MTDAVLSRMRAAMNSGPGRWVAVLLAVGLLVAAAARLTRDEQTRIVKDIRARGHKVLYYCRACQATGEVRLYETRFPITCPRCGKKQAVPAFRCVQPGCGQIIESRPELFKCPKCGRTYDHRPDPGMGDEHRQRRPEALEPPGR